MTVQQMITEGLALHQPGLNTAQGQLSCLFTSHELDVVRSLCHQLIVLRQGKKANRERVKDGLLQRSSITPANCCNRRSSTGNKGFGYRHALIFQTAVGGAFVMTPNEQARLPFTFGHFAIDLNICQHLF